MLCNIKEYNNIGIYIRMKILDMFGENADDIRMIFHKGFHPIELPFRNVARWSRPKGVAKILLFVETCSLSRN